MAEMMHCAGLVQRGISHSVDPSAAGAASRSCQAENSLAWHFHPPEQGKLSCSSSWAGVWVRPCSALPWQLPLPMTTLSSWGGHGLLEAGELHGSLVHPGRGIKKKKVVNCATNTKLTGMLMRGREICISAGGMDLQVPWCTELIHRQHHSGTSSVCCWQALIFVLQSIPHLCKIIQAQCGSVSHSFSWWLLPPPQDGRLRVPIS